MAWSGMDVAAVERVAHELRRQSDRIDTVTRAVDSAVASSQECWTGEDASRFCSGWQEDRSMLAGLSGSLELLAKKAAQQAADQRRSSQL